MSFWCYWILIFHSSLGFWFNILKTSAQLCFLYLDTKEVDAYRMLIEKHNSPFFFKGKLKSFNLKRRLYHPLMWHPLMTVTQMRRITSDFEQVHLLSLSCFCSDSEVKPCGPNSSGRSQQALASPECCWKNLSLGTCWQGSEYGRTWI